MKRIITVILAAVLILSTLTACGESDENAVAVQQVSYIIGIGAVGYVDRYAGLVVSGETADIKRDPEKKVKELKVKVGDTVKAGDVLFSYDTEAMQLKLDKLNLDYDELENKKTSAEYNLPLVQAKLRYATATDQLALNLQIQTLQSDILESEYNMNLKKREIAAMEKDMKNVDVCSPIDGRIMTVKEETGGDSVSSDQIGYSASGSDGSVSTQAYITVTDVSTLRVKGVINELNVGTLSEGAPVVVRSRMDEKQCWSGVLQKIDYDNPVASNSDAYYYGGGSDELTSSSKYAFYVTLDSFDGLLMGQHVYIEPDYGQKESEDSLWLPSYYVLQEGEESYVWAQGKRSRLEKRTVTLGELDENTGNVQILSGLTADDSIAFPEEGLTPGRKCVPYSEAMFNSEEETATVNEGGLG